jgi:hypothetical protein
MLEHAREVEVNTPEGNRKRCRGGCGTDLLGPNAPFQMYGICADCLAMAQRGFPMPPVDPQKAWQAVKEQRINRGLDPQNLSELVDEEAGYRNVVVGGAETLMEQERYA